MESLESLAVSKIVLGVKAHQEATVFSGQQQQLEQAQQVYLNTLAVYAVDLHLRSLGIQTDWPSSDSYQAVAQTLMNVADLTLPGLGALECRPVLFDSEIMYVPPEVWGDRIGYIAVQLNEDLSEATLLGFMETVDVETVPLRNLQSLDTFLEHLEAWENSAQNVPQFQTGKKPVSAGRLSTQSDSIAHLSRWLDRTVEAGWQIIEGLLDDWHTDTLEPAMAFRQVVPPSNLSVPEVIQCGKLLTLDDEPDFNQVRLLVGLRSQTSEGYEIRVKISPTQDPYLIPGLKLLLLDDVKEPVFQTQTRSKNDFLQFTFNGSSGDRFSVKIIYQDVSIEEQFMI